MIDRIYLVNPANPVNPVKHTQTQMRSNPIFEEQSYAKDSS
jgi:hypothetical protein